MRLPARRSRRAHARGLGGLLLAAILAPAQAQTLPVPTPAAPTPPAAAAEDAAKAVAGAWELSNAERDRSCAVTLKTSRAGAGGASALDLDKSCGELFPFTRNAAGWRIGSGDAIRFVDAKGQVVVEFSEMESGLYEAERPGEGLIFLQSAAAAAADRGERTATELAGEWNVTQGGGKPTCRLALSSAAAGGSSLAFALEVKPGCDAAVTRFGPVAWRLDRGQLVLLSGRDEAWRFEEGEAGTWRRVPEGARPLELVRAP